MTSLTLQAGSGGITFNSGDSLTVQNGATVNLVAGASFASLTSVTKATSGSSITLSGNASVQTTTGNLNLIAGGGITIGTGTVESTSGNILLQAVDQNITLGGTPWILNAINSGTPASVTLEAGGYASKSAQVGGNITIAPVGGIMAGQDWSVYMLAGANFSSPTISAITPGNIAANVTATSTAGASSITLSGSATVQTANKGIYLVAGGGITTGTGTTTASGTGPLQTSSGGSILLEDTQSIILSAPWTLPDNNSGTTATLTLLSGNNITFNNSVNMTAGQNWNVDLTAGANVNTGSVTSGTGTITLNGTDRVQTANGTITVLAGKSVTVGTGGIVTGIEKGAVITGAGGNINVTALSGNVNCGSSTAGYFFTQTGIGYRVSPSLGGISTAIGGNVSITAGGNILAYMPSSSSTVAQDPGSGAFGSAPGNVTLISTGGGDVSGHFVLANGTGMISANTAGNTGGLALSLVNGGWTVNAANSINLQEVRNPNGMCNNAGTPTANPFEHQFDYNSLSYVVLDAGQVTITGGGPRVAGASQEGLIFPPSLTVEAGAGGITLKQNVSLYPSPVGQLVMTTTGGGNLNGKISTQTQSHNIVISDSSNDHWVGSQSFANNAPNPDELLHLDDPNPVLINISGSVSDLNLYSPKAVQMFVAGNIIDSSVSTLNLHPTDTTIISAGGEILDHSDYVIVKLPAGEKPDIHCFGPGCGTHDPWSV